MSENDRVRAFRVRPGSAVLVLAGVAVVLGLLVRLALLAQPIGGDPGIYAYIGGRILDGDLPYRDVFEQKPPGVLYTYAVAFLLVGRSMFAVQVLDLAAWAILVALSAALAWSLWENRSVAAAAAGLSAVFVNPTLQSGFKQVGQTETWIAVWASAGVWLTLRATRRQERSSRADSEAGRQAMVAAIGAGLCCGVAALYKYNAATYLAACAAIVLFARGLEGRWRRVAAVAGGFLIPPAVVLAYFSARGGLSDLLDATVLYNVGYTVGTYGSPAAFAARAWVVTYRFLTMNIMWFMGAWGLLWLAARAWRGDRAGVPLILFAAAAYLAILANARFYPQYFLQILPPLVISSAFAVVYALTPDAGAGRRMLAVLFLGGSLWVGCRHTPVSRLADDVSAAARFAAGTLAKDDYYLRFGGYDNGGDFSLLADDRLAARFARETQADETVYIYGGEPLVLFLANRRSPSRFVWNDPFLAGIFRDRYTTADLIGELEAGRPAYVAVIRNDANMVDPVDSLTHFERDARLRDYITQEYREVGWLEDFLLFRRKDP